MTDDQRLKVTELRAAIAATAQSKEGAPMAVRAAVLTLRDQMRRDGITARVLAEAVGVHESTLCRWAKGGTRATKPRGGGAFRVVRVADAAPTVAPMSMAPASSARGLRVAHAPSGLVVDGLDVDTLAALLRKMS